MNKVKSIQNLLRDFLKTWNVEVLFLFNFSVVFRVFIKIISQKFSDNEQVLLVVEIVNDFQKILLVEIFSVWGYESQEFNLINGLVEVILIILNDLHANHLFSVDIVALDSFRECSWT